MIINEINDEKCTEVFIEILADQLKMDRVIRTCLQLELTSVHLKSLGTENASVNVAQIQGFTGRRGGYRPLEYQGNHPLCKNVVDMNSVIV